MKKLLLLPTAELIPSELRPDFGEIPSGLIPLGSKPALDYISGPYVRKGFEVLIAAHHRIELMREYAADRPALGAGVIDVGHTASIGQTIHAALGSLPALPGQLVINFADTYVADSWDARDAILYSDPPDRYRWTTFEIDALDRVTRIEEKNGFKDRAGNHVFVGIFSISDTQLWRLVLEEALLDRDGRLDPFYTAVAAYFNAMPAKRFIAVHDWRDFGHIDTYYQTQRSFFTKQRSFNTVAVDTSRGVVRKTSEHAAKLVDETNWYLSLPKSVQYLAPRVFDYSTDADCPFVEMEFYGYPALSDVYLFGQWDGGVWTQVLLAIAAALECMQSHRRAGMTSADRALTRRRMYEDKTLDRLALVAGLPHLRLFSSPDLRVNGKRCLSIPEVVERLPSLLGESGLYGERVFTILHGDLCLSNILYDRRNRFVRLVDPRGDFGGCRMYGDPLYDLAKLSHSLEGDYDFLVSGLFRSDSTGSEYGFCPLLKPHHLDLKALFHEWFLGICGPAYAQVKLVEGLLFLSMAALHMDQPSSQQAFVARGLELLSDGALSPATPAPAGAVLERFPR